MRARGHVLFFLCIVLTASSIGLALIASSLNRRTANRRSDEARVQALWLARSALTAAVTGVKDVPTAYGVAHVRVEKKNGTLVATARLGDGTAEVSREPWLERFEQP